MQDEVTDVICDNCGRNMVIKYGPHGQFPGMPGIPGVQKYQAIFREDRCALSEMRQGYCTEKDQKRHENIMDVRIIRNVILCPGRNHL